jgi:hypothetical protein
MERLLILAILVVVLALPGNQTWAGIAAPGPVIGQCNPNWAPIPGVAGVQYAPNVKSDLFQYRGNYYCKDRNKWYRGNAVRGPWTKVKKPPKAFHRIQASYFKVPPGWARGKKTGWQKASLPPGQMGKYGSAGDRQLQVQYAYRVQ